jgi:hypothetical protein
LAAVAIDSGVSTLSQKQNRLNQIHATTPDDLRIAIQEYGSPDGPEILSIHVLLGSHLAWLAQLRKTRQIKGRTQ